MLKIMLDKEREFNLSSSAVEAFEDLHDKPFEEIFEKGVKIRAKDVNFLLYSALIEKDISLEEFKIELAKKYTFPETIQLMNKLMGETDPNEGSVTENA